MVSLLLTLAKVSPKAHQPPAARLGCPRVQLFKLRIAKSPLQLQAPAFHNRHFPRSQVPEAHGVLSPVLCTTISAEKRPVKPDKKEKPSSVSRNVPGSTHPLLPKVLEPMGQNWGPAPWAVVLHLSYSQHCSPSTSQPTNPRQEHLTGGGSPRLFSQLQNLQCKNHLNGTKHPSPEPSCSDTPRKTITQAHRYNSIFILVRRCFTVHRPACTLEIIHVFYVLAVPSSSEITRQG